MSDLTNQPDGSEAKPPTLREALEQAPSIFEILARPTTAYQHWYSEVRRKALEATEE